jgi:hypothetical protein
MIDPKERIKQLEEKRIHLDKEYGNYIEENGIDKGTEAWATAAEYEIDLEIRVLKGEWT